MKKIAILAFLICFQARAQKVTLDPIDWSAADTLSIHFDFSGTAFSGITEDLFVWSWVINGSGKAIDSPHNGSWQASDARSKLVNLGNDLYKIQFAPETFFGLHAAFLNLSGFNFLIKNANGSLKTDDFLNIRPFYANGIAPNLNWSATKKVRLWVDVSKNLAGESGPLYYWGWYRKAGTNFSSPNNGLWSESDPASQMTRLDGTDLWYIDLQPTGYFGTNAADLSSTTVFGLVKKQNGDEGKTSDFGVDKPHLPYIISTINASNVTLSPALPPLHVPVTITFTAADELLNRNSSVFMHAGVVTDGLASTSWSHTQGIWGDSFNSPGKMTKIGPNKYEIKIPSINEYFKLSPGEQAYKIMAVFRNADGTLVEKDGGNDYQLEIQTNRYLEIREPQNAFNLKTVNEPFRITGFTNEIANMWLIVNGDTLISAPATNRVSTLFIPTAPGVYSIKILATNTAGILEKISSVIVCAQSSLALPATYHYGVNYDAADPTIATFVLHAPALSIRSVHVLGDFNEWTLNCDYLMQWDAAKKVFWKTISGLSPNREYIFQYLIDGKTRIGDPYAEKVSDPWHDAGIPPSSYPNLVQYPAAARPQNGETPTIATVLKTRDSSYSWQIEHFNRIPQERLNIYQLHFRDFTSEGTFLAAIEKLDYLKRLGINAIETLPVSEFEGNDSWGYNPNYYFAVDKAYGTKDDYKKFVDACHKRGMAVLGDFVLNHAFGTNPHARMYWDYLRNRPATNNPWFNATSNFSNPAAQWGNDFNQQSLHTQAFVDSVIGFWLKEYKIDGIRFDFTKGFGNTPYPNAGCPDQWGGCYDQTRINLLKRMADKMWGIDNGATGSHPYVIFEHLATATEDTEIGNYGRGILLWSGVSPNKKYGEIAMGWAPDAADPDKSNIAEAYYKNKGFAKPVWVSYMESHDEDRLGYFQTAYGNGNIKTYLALRAQFLSCAAVMNLLLPGPRQLWQFGELGYDYHINFNGRTGKKPVRWDYADQPDRKTVYETYARLFWLRNRLPITFHQDIDNLGEKTDFKSQFKRYHFYNATGDTTVTIIANTANSIISGDPKFNGSMSSPWFEFMSQSWQNPSSSFTLAPRRIQNFLQ